VTYACITLATTTGDENRLNIFKRKLLRIIYEPIYNPDIQGWGRRRNQQLNQIYKKSNIVKFMRSKIGVDRPRMEG
jgi:hypothetical protein